MHYVSIMIIMRLKKTNYFCFGAAKIVLFLQKEGDIFEFFYFPTQFVIC
jgi:hypothetical protein